MRRHKMNRRSSEKMFTRGALRVHPRNATGGGSVMRGGIRF